MTDIKAGDLVRLKAGGPDMVVEAVTGNRAICVWFDKAKHNSESFALETIGTKNDGVGKILDRIKSEKGSGNAPKN